MAVPTYTDPSTLPASGGDIDAEPLANRFQGLHNFLNEASNVDEDNVDLTSTDGLVGKSTAQTITGLKSFSEISAAAGGVRTAAVFQHNPASGTAADNDGVEIIFRGDDDGGNTADYAEIEVNFTDVSNTTEDADFYLKTLVAGTARNVLSVGSSGTVFNEDSQDIDFRIETDNIANGFSVDAGLDTFSFGAAAVDDQFLKIATPTATHTATTNTYALNVQPGGAQTIPSGTTAYVGSVNIEEPNITATGTVTNAFTLRIGGAPTEGGTTNYALWVDAGATQLDGTITVGASTDGHDVKFFGNAAGAYMEWDESEDQLRIMGASADATTSTGKLLLATSLTDINANDVLGKIDFQAPHEATGTDAIAIAASIQAVAQATFTATVNSTDLLFLTGDSEAATEKFRITSQGELGVGGANYGTDGQVLTSTGAGTAPAWESVPSSVSLSGSTNNTVATVTGSNALAGEASLTYDDTNGLGVTSATASKPIITVQNTNNGATSGYLKFINDKGAAGADNDVCGTITFYGDDDNQDNIEFARIEGVVADASNGDECGALKLYVAENDGTNTVGLALTGSTTDGEVDVALGAGAASVLTVPGHIDLAGDIDVDGTLEADAITIGSTAIGSIYGVVAGSSSIVTTGALDSGSITSGFGTIDTGSSTITTTGALASGAITAGGVVSVTDGSASAPGVTNTGDTNTGMLFPAADTIGLAAGGVEIMRAGTNGLAIGNAGILASGSTFGDAIVRLGGNGVFMTQPSAAAGNGLHIAVNAYLDSDWKAISDDESARLQMQDGVFRFYTAAAPADFGASPNLSYGAIKMQLDVNGNLGIAMSPGGSHKLDVTGSAGLSTGTAWTNTSDVRIKENVATITGATDKLKRLRPVSYRYTDQYLSVHGEINGALTYHSFIADEYATVFPNAVSTQGDLVRVVPESGNTPEQRTVLLQDLKQYTPHDLPIFLVRAIQELDARITALE